MKAKTYLGFNTADEVSNGLTSENNFLIENKIIVDLDPFSNAWEVAMDTVDYPVDIVNGLYNDNGETVRAEGETNTGRFTGFNFVVVDRLRDGNRQAISAVTDLYGTVQTKDVYADLKEQLELSGLQSRPTTLYVSGNGGSQMLTVELPGMHSTNCVPDELDMRLVVSTSVDGKGKHSMSLVAHNKTTKVDMEVLNTSYNLSARHTNTIGDRTVNFVPTLKLLIDNWNDYIMPTMALMFDKKFDRNGALELLEETAKEAGMGEQHRIKIRDLYSSGAIRTNDKSDSMYRVTVALNQYISDEMEDKVELQQRFKRGVAKSVDQLLKSLVK